MRSAALPTLPGNEAGRLTKTDNRTLEGHAPTGVCSRRSRPRAVSIGAPVFPIPLMCLS